MRTVDVLIPAVTAEAAFYLPALADLLCPFDPGVDQRVGGAPLNDLDYLGVVAYVLDRTVARLAEIDPSLNVTACSAARSPRQQACQAVIAASRALEEQLVLYLNLDFAALVPGQAPVKGEVV
jgi:hypothetical protein